MGSKIQRDGDREIGREAREKHRDRKGKGRDAQGQKDVEMERDSQGRSSSRGWEREASRDRETETRQTEMERQRERNRHRDIQRWRGRDISRGGGSADRQTSDTGGDLETDQRRSHPQRCRESQHPRGAGTRRRGRPRQPT